jgi:hypothetical protein
MRSFRNIKDDNLGDEAPRVKDFIIVITVVVILLLLSWVTYYKLGWFH